MDAAVGETTYSSLDTYTSQSPLLAPTNHTLRLRLCLPFLTSFPPHPSSLARVSKPTLRPATVLALARSQVRPRATIHTVPSLALCWLAAGTHTLFLHMLRSNPRLQLATSYLVSQLVTSPAPHTLAATHPSVSVACTSGPLYPRPLPQKPPSRPSTAFVLDPRWATACQTRARRTADRGVIVPARSTSSSERWVNRGMLPPPRPDTEPAAVGPCTTRTTR